MTAPRRSGTSSGSEAEYDAAPFVPDPADLGALRTAAARCQGCPLHEDTTGTVFGYGRDGAPLMLVGEQPGDIEDEQQTPFVGPAGRVLRSCLSDAGIAPDDVYLTNAVKHFKFRRQGKRRIHQQPDVSEVEACRPWLVAELRAVRPRVVVALGAVAARSVLGRATPIAKSKGAVFEEAVIGAPVRVTYHPSAALRRREHGDADDVLALITEALRLAAGH